MCNSVVACCVDWYIRNWTQSRVAIRRQTDQQGDHYTYIRQHPVLTLIRYPQPNVTPSTFWGWVLADYKLLGNAYVRKVRVGGGQPSFLQYLPADMVTPVGTDKVLVQYYAYTVQGQEFKISVDDMIHFRYGRDPSNIRMGRSPLVSVLKEIATDNQSSTLGYALTKNNAIPSMIVGPDGSTMVEMLEDDARVMKERLTEDFTGDNAGGIAVMTGPFKAERMSFSPSEMALDDLRRKPEERITAVLGLNCMVLGLGAGIERNTYHNYGESRQAAWEDGMEPLQCQIAEFLTMNLLQEYPDMQDDDVIAYDNSMVRAMDDDKDALVMRAERLYKAGISDRAEARLLVGLDANNADENAFLQAPAADESTVSPDEAPVLRQEPTISQVTEEPTRAESGN